MADRPERDPAAPAPSRWIELPDDLYASVTRALASMPPARWAREAQALSERYRAPREAAASALATGRPQALGYLAMMLPATYAQLRGAMAATAARIPHWQPRSLLDLGSGPGGALWAAAAQWPSLRTLTAWEREPAFVELGRELARGSAAAAVREARWERVDLRQMPGAAQRYDLVVIGHVLNELSPELQRAVVAAAWQRTAGLLLIVEPGTSAAFPVVRAARDQLLAEGARTIAPCAHDAPCPLVNDWCHFPQRLTRPDFQRYARGAPSQWEDAKYCYAALATFGPDAPIWARIIREPTSNKAYAEIKTSTHDGITTYRALKRHREAYRAMRDLAWGGPLLEPPAEPVSAIELERVASSAAAPDDEPPAG
jgi:ribosomal protein RSM22 (predicted rRNA methylase)